MSLTLPPPGATVPYTLIALALIQNIPLEWDFKNGEKAEISYNGITGAEAVRAELEKNIPGKEVGNFFRD